VRNELFLLDKMCDIVYNIDVGGKGIRRIAYPTGCPVVNK